MKKIVDSFMKQPELGKQILELRENKGLTQSELAEKCNLSLRTIQRIESAEVMPRNYTIKLIFSNLSYDYESLIYNEALVFQSKNWFKRVFNNIVEIFNLKTNTMKKLSVLSVLAIIVTAGLFLSHSELKAQQIAGWFLAGTKANSYRVGLDKSVFKTGSRSAFLESIDKNINGFGTLMQTCLADDYMGKRVKMTAYIKSKDVSDRAVMWIRVDDSNQPPKVLGFGDTQDGPIKGTTDWAKYEIILDVPVESATLNFGVLLSGTGKVWLDGISFEVVNKMETETTGNHVNKKPTNLDFSK